MIRRPPRSTQSRSSAASDVYKRQSFGHIHGIGGHRSERSLIAASIASPDSRQTPDHSDDGNADYLCPVCMAATAMGTALAPTPPALSVEFAEAPIDLATEH